MSTQAEQNPTMEKGCQHEIPALDKRLIARDIFFLVESHTSRCTWAAPAVHYALKYKEIIMFTG